MLISIDVIFVMANIVGAENCIIYAALYLNYFTFGNISAHQILGSIIELIHLVSIKNLTNCGGLIL